MSTRSNNAGQWGLHLKPAPSGHSMNCTFFELLYFQVLVMVGVAVMSWTLKTWLAFFFFYEYFYFILAFSCWSRCIWPASFICLNLLGEGCPFLSAHRGASKVKYLRSVCDVTLWQPSQRFVLGFFHSMEHLKMIISMCPEIVYSLAKCSGNISVKQTCKHCQLVCNSTATLITERWWTDMLASFFKHAWADLQARQQLWIT